MERDLSCPQCVLEPHFLLPEKISFGDHVRDLSLKFRLPVVDVVQSFSKSFGVGRLCPQRQRRGFFHHVAGHVPYLRPIQRDQIQSDNNNNIIVRGKIVELNNLVCFDAVYLASGNTL